MRCPNCQADQDQKNFFCSSCGQELHPSVDNQHSESLPEVNFEGLVTQTVDEIKKQAHSVEADTLEKIQDRAVKWAKTNLFILGLASSFLILALALFGYKKITDLEDLIETESQKAVSQVTAKTEEVKLLASATVKTTELAKREIDDTLAEAEGIKKQLAEINVEQIQDRLDKLKQFGDQLRASLQDAEQIRKDLTGERESVQKLYHSFFSISLHIDGDREQRHKIDELLIPALSREGLQLNLANIVEIGVDKTEVLFYNEIAREQAEIIAAIVQESLGRHNRLEIRSIPMLDRNPREILIKLKLL